jgi:hypothetical protein
MTGRRWPSDVPRSVNGPREPAFDTSIRPAERNNPRAASSKPQAAGPDNNRGQRRRTPSDHLIASIQPVWLPRTTFGAQHDIALQPLLGSLHRGQSASLQPSERTSLLLGTGIVVDSSEARGRRCSQPLDRGRDVAGLRCAHRQKSPGSERRRRRSRPVALDVPTYDR